MKRSRCVTQISRGVEAAHEAGIIHRDLKPGNVKLTPDGKVKVLDFGLAKETEEGSSSSIDLTRSPTITAAQSPTAAGVILGTAPYMSPEQARGRPVDRRTDIWSFGVMLYECLTGASPFVGETVSDSIAAILQAEVEFDRLPAGDAAVGAAGAAALPRTGQGPALSRHRGCGAGARRGQRGAG